MRKFKKIITDVRTESLYDVMTKQRHIRFGFEFNEKEDENLIRNILMGVTMIELKALETQSAIIYARKEDKDYLSSIVNFFNNKYSVDGFFYKDLSGLENSIFEDQSVKVHTLKVPFTEEEKNIFVEGR